MKKNYSTLRFILKLGLLIFGASFAYQLLSPAPISNNRQHLPKSVQSSDGPPTRQKEKEKHIKKPIDNINYQESLLETLPIIIAAIVLAIFVARVLWKSTNPITQTEHPNLSFSSNYGQIPVTNNGSNHDKSTLEEQIPSTTRPASRATAQNFTIRKQNTSITSQKQRKQIFKESRSLKESAEWFAAAKDSNEQADSLKKKYENKPSLLHNKNINENKALHVSAIHGNLPGLKFLAPKHEKYPNDLKKALMLSAKNGHKDCVSYLLTSYKDQISDNSKNNSLFLSAQGGHLDCLKLLVTHKANIDKKNEKGNTALQISAFYGFLDCVKFLGPT